MWPFTRRPTDSERVAAIDARLEELENGWEKLASSQRSVRLEWEDTYDKVMKAVARLNARTRRAAEGDGDAPPGPRVPTADEVNDAIRTGRYPTPQLDRR